MKYKINELANIYSNDDEIIIENKHVGSQVALPIVLKDVINQIINEKDVEEIILDFQQNFNFEYNLAKKNVNSIIYSLLMQNLIFPCTQKLIDGKEINLKSALIEITDTCNFRCPHCYVNKTHINLISLEDIKDISTDLKDLNCNRIALSGGELFTNPDFLEIYQHLYDQGFVVSINTNLSLLNSEILSCFNQKPPYEIEVSLYGYNDESFNDFTKTKNQFNLVIDNLKQLKENHFNVILKNIITKDNMSFFNKIEEKAKELGFKFKSDYISFPKVCDKFGENSQQISPLEAVTHLKQHKGAKEHFRRLFSKEYKPNNKIFKCMVNDDSIFINSKKEVSMCVCMQSLSFKYEKGNIYNLICKFREIRERTYTVNSKCENCKYMTLCRYCPGKFYMTTSSYEEPPKWFCEFGKLLYDTFIDDKEE